jgi:hypothetical protein
MLSSSDTSTSRLLVTVKAYPNPSTTYGETVCVAGVTVDDPRGPQWQRLYPLQFRDMESEKQFRKWDIITVTTTMPRSDHRPESRCPLPDTIERIRHIESDRAGWAERRLLLEPVTADSMCEVRRRERSDRTSLAAIRPADISDIRIELNEEAGRVHTSVAGQLSFARPDKRLLDILPYRFKFMYRCSDPRCNGHAQTIVDWELGQFFRRQLQAGVSVRDAGDRTRDRWMEVVCGPTRDPLFFVGNQSKHPTSFLVLGVFWPPRQQPKEQLALF